MKKTLFIIFVLIIIFSISLVVFIKSPSFLRVAVNFVNTHTNLRVGIGSLSIVNGNRVIIKDLLIETKDKDGFHLSSPYSEIQASLKGIIRKNINEIVLTNPKLTVAYRKDEKGRTSLPFSFNKITVRDGDVTIKTESAELFNVSAINVSLIELPNRKNAELRGSALISGLDSTVSLTGEINIEKFDINHAQLKVSPIDLESLSAKLSSPLLQGKTIKGVADISIDAARVDDGAANKISWIAAIVARDFSILSKSLSLDSGGDALNLSAQGVYVTEQNTVEIESLTARLSDLNLLMLHGKVTEIFSGDSQVNLAAESNNIPLRKIKDIVSGSSVKWLDAINENNNVINVAVVIAGRITSPEVRGEVSASGDRLAWGNTTLQSFSTRFFFEYADKLLAIKNASVSAAEGSYISPADNSPVIKLHNTKLVVPRFVFEPPILKADPFHLNSNSMTVSFNNKAYSEKAVSVKGTIEGNLKTQAFRIRNLLVDTDLMKNIAGDISFTRGSPAVAGLSLRYDSLDAEKLSQIYFRDFLAQKGISVKGGGTLKATLKATIPEDKLSHISGTAYLNLLNAGFSTSDGTTVAEGMDLKVSNNFEFALPFNHAYFTLDSEAANFELLTGKFYGSFRDKVLSFSAKGNYTASPELLNISESKTSLTNTGNIFIAGGISELTSAPLFDLNVQLDSLSNKEAYNFFIRETFQQEFPVLSELDVNGESNMKLNVRGTREHFTATGEINISDMNILAGSPDKAVRNINLHLPVNIIYPQGAIDKKNAEFGSLKIKELAWAALKLKDVEIFPSVWRNSVIFRNDIRLPIMGGDIILKNILYGDILSPQRQMRLSIDIKDIDLEKASVAFELPEFNGNLSGTIPVASFADNRIRTDGEIVLKLFNGEMRVGNLSIDNVFSPVTSFKADIDFEEIDLGKLTGTFDFGHVSGIIKGSIRDITVVKGQAESFTASLETYKRKGVEQKISVEALKKISILGAGSTSSALERGIYQLFKEYRYEKLGFRAFLKNDNLLLLGIENEGDRGYLVKGGLLPPKVNVISYTQNISFQDMVERLKRVKQTE